MAGVLMRTLPPTFVREAFRPLRGALAAVSATIFVLLVTMQGVFVVTMQRVHGAGPESPIDLAHAMRAHLSQIVAPAIADAIARLEPFVWITAVLAATVLPLLIVVLGRDCLSHDGATTEAGEGVTTFVIRRAAALLFCGVLLVAVAALLVAWAASALLPGQSFGALMFAVANTVGLCAIVALPAVGIAILTNGVVRRPLATVLIGLCALSALGALDFVLRGSPARVLFPAASDIPLLLGKEAVLCAVVHVLWVVSCCALAIGWLQRRARSDSPVGRSEGRTAPIHADSRVPLAASPEVRE